MSASSAPRPWRQAVLRTVVGTSLAVGLAGCTVATSASGTSSSVAVSASPSAAPVAAARAGATVVVTVPQLGSPAPSALSSSSRPVRSSSRVGSTSPDIHPTLTGPSPDTRSVATTAMTTTRAPSTSAAQATTTATTTTASTATATAATLAPATLSVKLANCPSCTVLGTHAGVTSTLGAALVATGAGKAALLALRADGSVAGVGNVVYGTTFPTQAGGQLACDSRSRCIVIAQQSDGTAIASAYQVSAQGVWSEVTGEPGIASVTGKAQTLTVDGDVGVAVQDEADGTTVWLVYVWQGDGYGVTGCTAAATPDPNALSMDDCLS
jgi:hypothetical protein